MLRSKIIGISALLAFSASASALNVTLPTSDPLRVVGSNNPLVDPFFIDSGSLIGTEPNPYDDPTITGDETIATFELPSYLVELASMTTTFELPDEDTEILEEVGEFHDAVFRDTRDNMLVFGSRIEIEPGEEGEINDVFRRGYTGLSTTVGWVAITDIDLRLITAARTSNSGVSDDPDVFNANVVDLQTDINVEEGNPISGWFLIKTDATGYRVLPNAVGLFQAGEEDQTPFLTNMAGFAPVPVPAALPLLLSGLGLLGWPALRRRFA